MINISDNLYYIFDAEGTIFFTNKLNNESYNYALIKNGFAPIKNVHRITRDNLKDIYYTIDQSLLNKIILQKQDYFINNIGKIRINYFLFNIIKKIERNKSILWTASNHKKIEYIIEKFNIKSYFGKIIFSDKTNIFKSLIQICESIQCEREQLLIFENNYLIAEELKKLNINCLLFICPYD